MNKNLILETKPQFNLMLRFCSINFVVALVVVTIITFVSFFFFVVTNDFTESSLNLYKMISLGSFLIVMLLALFLNKMNYLVTKYQIYSDKIYFEEGFIDYKSKAVNLADVKEIQFTQNFFQRAVGLGTIKFLSPANAPTGNSYSNSGVEFKDIKNGQEIYEKIKEIFGLNNDLVLETKPKFNLGVRAVTDIFWAAISDFFVFLVYMLLLLYAAFTSCFMHNMDVADKVFDTGMSLAVPVLIGVYIITLVITLFVAKKRYENSSYKAYSDHIEFNEGFINYKHKFIKLDNIKEIHLLQSFIERMAELGTIRFVSAGTGTIYDGITFSDIPNSLAVYTKVKQLHEEN